MPPNKCLFQDEIHGIHSICACDIHIVLFAGFVQWIELPLAIFFFCFFFFFTNDLKFLSVVNFLLFGCFHKRMSTFLDHYQWKCLFIFSPKKDQEMNHAVCNTFCLQFVTLATILVGLKLRPFHTGCASKLNTFTTMVPSVRCPTSCVYLNVIEDIDWINSYFLSGLNF